MSIDIDRDTRELKRVIAACLDDLAEAGITIEEPVHAA